MPVYKSKEEKTKDNKIWYYMVSYTDLLGSKKRYKSKKYATKDEATKEEAKFRLSIGKGTKQNFTFGSIYNEFYLYKSDKVRPTTLSRISVQYQHIKPYFENVKITELTKQKYIQWQNEMNKKGLSTEYKNKIVKLLQELLNYSENMYGITSNVLKAVGKFVNPTERKKEMDFYTYEEFNKFISQVDDLTYKTFFTTLYYCGLRLGEAQSLNWNDIDFKKKTISINKSLTTKIKGEKFVIMPPKTKSSIRTLPIPKIAEKSLLELYNSCKKIKDFNNDCFVFGVFFPLPDTTIKKRYQKYCIKTNIRKIRIHDFRHSCASLLINNGANITLVAKYLGHSNITMTLNTYSHMYKSKLDEVIEIIDNLN